MFKVQLSANFLKVQLSEYCQNFQLYAYQLKVQLSVVVCLTQLELRMLNSINSRTAGYRRRVNTDPLLQISIYISILTFFFTFIYIHTDSKSILTIFFTLFISIQILYIHPNILLHIPLYPYRFYIYIHPNILLHIHLFPYRFYISILTIFFTFIYIHTDFIYPS